MEDPKSKKTGRESPGAGGHGVGVPAKGDSSASNPSIDPLEGATISDAPAPTPTPPAKPPTRVANPDATIAGSLSGISTPSRAFSSIYLKHELLQPGDLIGGRYEILQLLGEGGMGAVYKALDREVERTVALKLIRPELASNPAILARFKQELLTAHQVTHKNVIRIYDLAEADGVKFITMEFVEGSDLRHILVDNGKLPLSRAIEIIRQVCLALDAAHSAGVIHRDLKPQNIMQDSKSGRILVMDFGLARSIESEGMTQTGALLGTIEYMSPEQSMGKTLDQRSDIFALGLIFYELLTGKTPYKADTAMASLLRRNQERAIPAAELDTSVPKGLSDIVSKCLERDLEQRYQNVQELLADLDAYEGARPTLASIPLRVTAPVSATPTSPWKWVSIGALAIIVISGGWLLRGRLISTNSTAGVTEPAKTPDVTLAILPFSNASGDSSLNWIGPTLADMVTTGVGQSAQMRIISPDRLRQVLSELRITPETVVDPTMVSHIADSSSANTVFWGKYVRLREKIRIEGVLQDLKHDKSTTITVEAPSDKDFTGTANAIAEQIRTNLSVSADVLKDLKASSYEPSSKSAAALRDYTQGVQFLREGRNLEAVKILGSSVQEDPEFALAYSRLAEANSALGYDSDAEKNSRKALDLSQSLPQGERYLIEATHARVTKDNRKATAAYENLAKIMPDNVEVEYALGSLYLDQGEYDKSRALFERILKADPNNIPALWQISGVDAYQGNAQGSLEPLTKALSQTNITNNQEQKALILLAMGSSYRQMNKPEEAIKNYQESMEVSTKLGLQRMHADTLSELALVQSTLGKPDAARASYDEALKILNEIGMKKEYGDVLINRGLLYQTRGDFDKALEDYKASLAIQRDFNDENFQSLCLNNIGDSYLSKGDTDNALIYLQQSLELRKKLNQPTYLAETLGALGEVYSAIGDYDKSLTSLMAARDASRKANDTNAAAAVSGSIGMVLVAQGRLGAAVSAMQESVQGYRTVNNRSLDMAAALNSLADTLALAGRGVESGKPLDEAQQIAHDLKNENINSQLLNTRGDVAFYQGDLKTAKGFYEQAAAAANKAKQKDAILVSKMNLARVAIAEGRSQSAIADLRAAIQQAESLHLKYYAVRSSADLAQALMNTKDYAHARQQLDSALGQSEKLGLRLETVRIRFLLGDVLQHDGQATEAARQYQQAQSLLDGIRKEAGAEHLAERFDLRKMAEAAGHSLTASN
jgi:serine/threonine protein kinase/tetratricopeptide (TPR) repeat protein